MIKGKYKLTTITPSVAPVIFSPISYKISDPWYYTPVLLDRYLDIYINRTIPPSSDDKVFLITEVSYVNRPDTLANDIYGDRSWWWVFGVRNGLEDPIFDLKLGTLLIVPSLTVINGI